MRNNRMRAARAERGMSQADLAAAVWVTRQTISMMESGNYNPTLRLCVAVFRCLGKTLDALFWEEET